MLVIRHLRSAQFIVAVLKSGLSKSLKTHLIETCSDATLAYKVGPTSVTAAIAICSDNDQFSRKAGRLLATTRLEAAPSVVSTDIINRAFSPKGLNSPTIELDDLNPQLFSEVAFNTAIENMYK